MDSSEDEKMKSTRFLCSFGKEDKSSLSLVMVESVEGAKSVFDFPNESSLSGSCLPNGSGYFCSSPGGEVRVDWASTPGTELSQQVTITRKLLFGTLGLQKFDGTCKKTP